jgi:preprotein translocase subunit YajC
VADTTLADTTANAAGASEKLYKAEYVGSGTFIITKPKRKKMKQRQSNLKNVRRGSRK